MRTIPVTVTVAAVCLFAVVTGPRAEIFIDRASALGLDFEHFNGMSGETYFAEMMGSGAALLDYDQDGDLDIYLVQGAMLGPGKALADALLAPKMSPLTDRLYRNDMQSGDPDTLKFTDVTAEAGLNAHGYGMGVSTGDVNNDGYPDLYLANFGANQLWMNQRDGSFRESTVQAGVGDDRWSITGVFFDANADGWDDLYVVNYVSFSFASAKTCRSHFDAPDYCSPQSYEPVSDRLFLNRGDGTFEDVSARSGIDKIEAPGLGVVAGDFNGDNRVDLYVANDGASNQLWINQGEGRFADEALLAGVAVNMQGQPEASMGVDAADFDGDGDLDLFMTHLDRQTNTLYVNDGNGWFTDRTASNVLGSSSFAFTGFGTLWFDYDNDGWLDLLSANGAVVKIEEQVRAGEALPLRQRNQLWRNRGSGNYQDVSADAGAAFSVSAVSRGAAFGDLDNDGATDVVITNNAARPQLLINQAGATHQWIGLDLRAGGRQAVGSTVQLVIDERVIHRRSRTDGSYQSAHDPRILAGLGAFEGLVKARVRFPDGTVRDYDDLKPGRYHILEPAEADSK